MLSHLFPFSKRNIFLNILIQGLQTVVKSANKCSLTFSMVQWKKKEVAYMKIHDQIKKDIDEGSWKIGEKTS